MYHLETVPYRPVEYKEGPLFLPLTPHFSFAIGQIAFRKHFTLLSITQILNQSAQNSISYK